MFQDGSLFVMDPAVVSGDKAVSFVVAYAAKVDQEPSVPTGFKAEVEGDSVVLTWDKNPSVDKVLYNIYWEGGGDQQMHAVGDADYIETDKRLTPRLVDGNRVKLSHLDPARKYSFFLMAVGFNGKISRTSSLIVLLKK